MPNEKAQCRLPTYLPTYRIRGCASRRPHHACFFSRREPYRTSAKCTRYPNLSEIHFQYSFFLAFTFARDLATQSVRQRRSIQSTPGSLNCVCLVECTAPHYVPRRVLCSSFSVYCRLAALLFVFFFLSNTPAPRSQFCFQDIIHFLHEFRDNPKFSTVPRTRTRGVD